jgi:ketosteroid isomerase-like protein
MADSRRAAVSSSKLVAALWARLQARDWESASALLAENFVSDWPTTSERITSRDRYIRVQQEYPEPWGPIQVLRLVADGRVVAAEVSVPGAQEEFRCSAFYKCHDGLIQHATEYWDAVGGHTPPPGRERLVELV